MSRSWISRSIAVRSAAVVVAALLLQAAVPGAARAEELGSTPTAAAPAQFAGTVNANDVYVRSGPGDNYYATLKLDKGAPVTVVGLKFDWLKIVPPPGSFCYVAKAYVEQRGDGTIGRVTKPELNVRAGSSLNAMKSAVETKLDEGVDVQILGEQDEYFKIKPPAGSYLYVNKQFVDPVRTASVPAPVAPAEGGTASASAGSGNAAGGGGASDGDMAPVPATGGPMVSRTPQAPAGSALASSATTQPAAVASATTQPAGQTTGTAVARATTQPAEPSVEARFDAAEASFLDATNKQIDAQPLDALLASYTSIAGSDDLPVSMRRIAEMRIATIKARQEVRQQYADTMKMEAAAADKERSLRVEQDELQQRIKQQQVTVYTALGTLRTSSLQPAGGTLYRLTDPGTGRTMLYLRSDDPKYAMLLNQFIGVRGDVTEDSAMSLRIITPTSAEPVDESKVNLTVSAENIPPTLMPKAPTASVAAGD